MHNRWIDLNVTIVTPTFIDGPRGATLPSEMVRGTTFKHGLRRGVAMCLPQSMSGNPADQVIDTLYGQAADDDPSGTPSLIAVRTEPGHFTVADVGTPTDQLLGSGARKLNYLLGLGLAKYDRHRQQTLLDRRCLKPGSTFLLQIRARARSDQFGDPLLLSLIGLRCLELYGGVGSHTSRGWGAIQIDSDAPEWADAVAAVPAWPAPGTVAAAAHTAPLMHRVRPLLPPPYAKTPLISDPPTPKEYAQRSRSLESTEIYRRPGTHRTALEAMADASDYLLNLRRPIQLQGRNQNRQITLEWKARGTNNMITNAPIGVLGLPIQYYVPGRGTYTLNYSLDRFPSPLHLRPVRTPSGWAWGSVFYNDWPETPAPTPNQRHPAPATWTLNPRHGTPTRLNDHVTLGDDPALTIGDYSSVWHDGLQGCISAEGFRRYVERHAPKP